MKIPNSIKQTLEQIRDVIESVREVFWPATPKDRDKKGK